MFKSEKTKSPLKIKKNSIDDSIQRGSTRKLILRIVNLLQNEKADEIVCIDANNKLSFTNYLIICQGRSQLHCRSIAQNLEYNLKQEGEISSGCEGEREGNWVLLDYGEIILHIFHPEIRRYYNLEELYLKHLGGDYLKNINLSNN